MTDSGRRILVIEDHPALGRFIAATLSKAGWAVVGPVADRAAAIEAARGGRLDFAVMDCVLQNGDTFDVADQLAQRGVRLLLMSGFSRASLPYRFRDVPFLEKPFSMDALLDAVREAAQRSR
jgi:DNA-binding response OmpR family regulator